MKDEERAELKEKENTVHTLDVLHKEAVRKYGEVNDQLTKAKEILRGLYFIIQSRIDYENNTGIADEMWRAEQILKEE